MTFENLFLKFIVDDNPFKVNTPAEAGGLKLIIEVNGEEYDVENVFSTGKEIMIIAKEK